MKMLVIFTSVLFSTLGLTCDCINFEPDNIVNDSPLIVEGTVIYTKEDKLAVSLTKIHQNKILNTVITNPWQLKEGAIYVFDGSEMLDTDCGVDSNKIKHLGRKVLFIVDVIDHQAPSRREYGKMVNSTLINTSISLNSCTIDAGFLNNRNSESAKEILNRIQASGIQSSR